MTVAGNDAGNPHSMGLSVPSFETGKVLDVSVMSKHRLYKNKFGDHGEICKANYAGSSGGMEVTGAQEIFHRSEELYDVRYLDFLSDGDSKAFPTVNHSKPYETDVDITKI